ncbi:unnamed protein product [Amoebophrya sp. A120]|nr:unnamed protein product [Amoebophrya sp. A120]|eukprot:GSA120T00003244001.1
MRDVLLQRVSLSSRDFGGNMVLEPVPLRTAEVPGISLQPNNATRGIVPEPPGHPADGDNHVLVPHRDSGAALGGRYLHFLQKHNAMHARRRQIRETKEYALDDRAWIIRGLCTCVATLVEEMKKKTLTRR